ncbi:hypothetical protein VT03_17125 [Planctomyces sp. SH-PL14]|nr:hypothetical protein VT03_17125 [Planctomyces sp. SH-PL14]
MDGLERAGLIEEVPNGYRVTELGRRVRAEMPAFGHGGPRVWTGLAELPALPAELIAENDRSPPACPI